MMLKNTVSIIHHNKQNMKRPYTFNLLNVETLKCIFALTDSITERSTRGHCMALQEGIPNNYAHGV